MLEKELIKIESSTTNDTIHVRLACEIDTENEMTAAIAAFAGFLIDQFGYKEAVSNFVAAVVAHKAGEIEEESMLEYLFSKSKDMADKAKEKK